MRPTGPRRWRRIAVFVALAVLGLAGVLQTAHPPAGPTSAIDAAFEARRSDAWVEDAGIVERVLADDRDGSRHQRFIVRLASGRTVLIAHNIDLAPRLEPLRPGDPIRFRGQYEWNSQGGVVHWTHHDPSGRREGGWIEHGGRRTR